MVMTQKAATPATSAAMARVTAVCLKVHQAAEAMTTTSLGERRSRRKDGGGPGWYE